MTHSGPQSLPSKARREGLLGGGDSGHATHIIMILCANNAFTVQATLFMPRSDGCTHYPMLRPTVACSSLVGFNSKLNILDRMQEHRGQTHASFAKDFCLRSSVAIDIVA